MSNSPSQHPAVSNEITEDEFIDLSKIYASVKRQRAIFFICVFSATLIALVLTQLLPKQWAATTTLQIGKISPNLIEPTSQVVERLKLREIQGRMMAEAHYTPEELRGDRAALFKKTLRAKTVKGSDFIEIRVADLSPEAAAKSLHAVVQVVLAGHAEQFSPFEKRVTQQLQDKKNQIAILLDERKQWNAHLLDTKKATAGAPFTQNVVTLNMLNGKEIELRKLRAEQVALEEILAPSQTYPTRVVDAVAADSSYFFPRLGLFTIAGLLLGVMFGLIVALFRDRHHGKAV